MGHPRRWNQPPSAVECAEGSVHETTFRTTHRRVDHRGDGAHQHPAFARPIEKGHFHDVFISDVYDCEGTPAQDNVDVSANFLGNLRGSSPFPYFREACTAPS